MPLSSWTNRVSELVTVARMTTQRHVRFESEFIDTSLILHFRLIFRVVAFATQKDKHSPVSSSNIHSLILIFLKSQSIFHLPAPSIQILIAGGVLISVFCRTHPTVEVIQYQFISVYVPILLCTHTRSRSSRSGLFQLVTTGAQVFESAYPFHVVIHPRA